MPFNVDIFISEALTPKLTNFNELAIALYNYQSKNNDVFAAYLRHTNAITPINRIESIRFLPISFYKTHTIKTGDYTPLLTFSSSTTTGSTPSLHHLSQPYTYQKSYLTAFKHFYGNPEDYEFLFLLPNYLERSGSSLVTMAEGLAHFNTPDFNRYFLYNFEQLASTILQLKKSTKKLFILGVTYALLDFAEQFPIDLNGHIVMETGGMKGRKKELTRNQVHHFLCKQFNLPKIDAEYGMTELLSQAYSKGYGYFFCPPWMHVYITDPNDPFSPLPTGKTGVLNIIDLANVESCAFIQTQDLGRINDDGSFEVLGRIDFSELRGCNLMYTG